MVLYVERSFLLRILYQRSLGPCSRGWLLVGGCLWRIKSQLKAFAAQWYSKFYNCWFEASLTRFGVAQSLQESRNAWHGIELGVPLPLQWQRHPNFWLRSPKIQLPKISSKNVIRLPPINILEASLYKSNLFKSYKGNLNKDLKKGRVSQC